MLKIVFIVILLANILLSRMAKQTAFNKLSFNEQMWCWERDGRVSTHAQHGHSLLAHACAPRAHSGAQVAIYGMSAQKAFIISRKYGNPRCMIVAVLTIFIIILS